jgi:uncharacterized protein (TIGR00156 family)
MKKIYMICFIAAILTLTGCEDGENIFSMDRKNVTVSEVDGLRDGTPVRLTGAIEFGTGEMHQFSDNTGNIPVEIDAEVWIGSGINLASLNFPFQVEIEGEVDKERDSVTYIDVTRIRLL